MAGNFTSIPILDYPSSQSPNTKPAFLAELRDALVKVGFFQVRNPPIPHKLQQDALRLAAQFFDLPTEKKLEIENIHSKRFLGYSRINSESTASGTDYLESILLGPDLPALGPEEPIYLHLQGPSQWPEEVSVPGFRDVFEAYHSRIQEFSVEFTNLIAEALEMPIDTLTKILGQPLFSRLKPTRYLPPSMNTAAQEGSHGIGPHKDIAFMTYLLQGGTHNCLEVQNKSGDWIPVPPVPEALVVNIGRLLEIVTGGVCVATTHRVILKPEGFKDGDGKSLGPRISLPFFQFANPRLMVEEVLVDVPQHIKDLVPDQIATSDAETFFSGLFNNCVGDNIFVNHLTTYPRVGKIWYPDLLQQASDKQAESKQRDQQRRAVEGQI
ncbi:putative oxidoreductase, 2OG-Fe(II) oxygenase family [Fusarium austroafricanum]|uniref:Putative oxidoreductase, 2OG-Fe(II) oxygenase family n=1 Tax=Fusarium austroafricanum TaxID=2364996 RepID=A0A8H4KYA3_9HYPO|nr:putative oxidoreductase, 2OG-Fe(II) oxygenase family [Fusarium austroafricanum]